MILVDFFVVLSKLFALIKFTVTYDYDFNSHLFFLFFFFTFSAFSPKFGKLFGKVSFRQDSFSAKWLFGEVVFGKVSCIPVNFPNFNSPSQIIVQLMPMPMHFLLFNVNANAL